MSKRPQPAKPQSVRPPVSNSPQNQTDPQTAAALPPVDVARQLGTAAASGLSPRQLTRLSRQVGNRAATALLQRRQEAPAVQRVGKTWASTSEEVGDKLSQTPAQRAAALHQLLSGSPKANLKTFDQVADLLAGPDLSADFSLAAGRSVRAAINAVFSGHMETYLVSMTVGTNGTPVGEPTFVAELLLSTGLIQGRMPSSDNTETLNLITTADPAELLALRAAPEWAEIKARITRARGGGRVADYVDKKLETAHAVDQQPLLGLNLPHGVKIKAREELLSLLSLIADKPSTTRDSRLITSDRAAAKIQEWAAQTRQMVTERYAREAQGQGGQGGGQQGDPAGAAFGTIVDYIVAHDQFNGFFESHKIPDRHRNYVRDLLLGTKTGQGMGSAEALIAYHRKKEARTPSRGRRKSWHWDTLAARIESMSKEERLRFLVKRINPNAADPEMGRYNLNPEGLNEYITHLEGLGVPDAARSRIRSAFLFGAADHSTEKGSTYNTLRDKMDARHHVLESTVRKLLAELHPSEFLQVSRDQELMAWIRSRLGDGDGAMAHLEHRDELPNALKQRDKEGTAVDWMANKGTMNVGYWVAQFNQELGKKLYSRQKIFSLARQAYNTARRMQVLPFDRQDYPEDVPQSVNPVNPSDFLRNILAGLDARARAKLQMQDDISAVYQGLHEGRLPTVVEQATAVGKKFHQFGWVRGAFITPSAFMQMVEETEGQQLLAEWTNFHEFLAAARAYREARAANDADGQAAARTTLRSWVLQPKANKVQYLKKMLPKDLQFEVTRDLMLRLADAMEADPEFRETMDQFQGAQTDALEAERIRGMAVLIREQAVDTGLQVQWFSAKAPERRGAARQLTSRLRSVNEKIRDQELGQERAGFGQGEVEEATTGLQDAREALERRTEAFEKLKERVVDGTMFAISIVLGIAVSLATMGTAAPLIAAGLTATQAQFIIALVGTAVASTAKELIKWGMVGTLHNNREIVFNIVKSLALATATVGAGEISGAINDSSQFLTDLESNDATAFAFAEKFLNVSPVEVAMRTATETVLDQLTAIEPEERPIKNLADARNLALRYMTNTAFDALLKGTYDMMTSGIATESFADDDAGEDWIPDLTEANFGEVMAVILGENVVTAQNYSVAEQDAVIPMLIEKYGIDRVGEALSKLMSRQRVLGQQREAEEDDGGAQQAQQGPPMETARDLFHIALQEDGILQLQELSRRGLKVDDLFGGGRMVNVAANLQPHVAAAKVALLHDMGFEVWRLKQLGFPLAALLANDYTLEEYRSHYSFEEFVRSIHAQQELLPHLDDGQLCWTLNRAHQISILRAYREHTRFSLRALFDAAAAAQLPFTMEMARAAGYSDEEIFNNLPPRALRHAPLGPAAPPQNAVNPGEQQAQELVFPPVPDHDPRRNEEEERPLRQARGGGQLLVG